MAGRLLVRMSGTTGGRTEALERGALLDDGELNLERVRRKIVIVFRIRDSRLERLADETCRLARNEAQDFDGLGGVTALDGASDIAHLPGRHTGVFGICLDLHGDSAVLKCFDAGNVSRLNDGVFDQFEDKSCGTVASRFDDDQFANRLEAASHITNHSEA